MSEEGFEDRLAITMNGEWFSPGVLKPPMARVFPEMKKWRDEQVANGARVMSEEEFKAAHSDGHTYPTQTQREALRVAAPGVTWQFPNEVPNKMPGIISVGGPGTQGGPVKRQRSYTQLHELAGALVFKVIDSLRDYQGIDDALHAQDNLDAVMAVITVGMAQELEALGL